jgi:murein DD-endopeptidase MepM/ murein hydrolase activator NlpD
VSLSATGRARVRVLLIVVVVGIVLALVMFRARRVHSPVSNLNSEIPVQSPSTTASTTPSIPENANVAVSPSPAQTPVESLATPDPSAPPQNQSFVGELSLIVPVQGVRRDQLIDTFTASRAEGRVHDAIDIPAPAGTPVLAAADGEVVKLFQSERGGTTIYQLSSDRKLIYYYAHLQVYADGLTEGKFVHQGEVIAYVGDTGNAGAGNYHLHFSISIISDPKRYWEGTNINPYPILHH